MLSATLWLYTLLVMQFKKFFVQSDSHNLRYMGIDALSRLIKISPEIAEQHQLAVIDCLEVREMVDCVLIMLAIFSLY